MASTPPQYSPRVQRLYVTFIQGLVQYPDAEGWVMIHMGDGLLSNTVYASDAFPPFDDLVTFLTRIAQNQLPTGFALDEEGDYKHWLAAPLLDGDDELFHFSLMQDPQAVAGWRPLDVWMDGVFERRQFVREFYRKLANFLATEHRPDLWRFGPLVPEGLDRLEDAMTQWDVE